MKKTITGDRIKMALSARNMKASELASATKISKSMISEYIHGKYIPKQKNIYKIALALGVTESWLLGFDVPMGNQEIDLSKNQDVLNKWIESLSATKGIPKEFIKSEFDKSFYSNGEPIKYENFETYILGCYQDNQIDPCIENLILERESERHTTESEGVSNKKITIIHTMMCEFMNDDEVDKLYKLIELTFPDVVSKYKETFISIDEFGKTEEIK